MFRLSSLSSFCVAISMSLGAVQAQAFDQPGPASLRPDRVPAKYRIVTDKAHDPAHMSASQRYFSGGVRVIYVDGRPVKMPESEIVENIRRGHFVPVYSETGTRLSKDDWEISLPTWLAMPTLHVAR